MATRCKHPAICAREDGSHLIKGVQRGGWSSLTQATSSRCSGSAASETAAARQRAPESGVVGVHARRRGAGNGAAPITVAIAFTYGGFRTWGQTDPRGPLGMDRTEGRSWFLSSSLVSRCGWSFWCSSWCSAAPRPAETRRILPSICQLPAAGVPCALRGERPKTPRSTLVSAPGRHLRRPMRCVTSSLAQPPPTGPMSKVSAIAVLERGAGDVDVASQAAHVGVESAGRAVRRHAPGRHLRSSRGDAGTTAAAVGHAPQGATRRGPDAARRSAPGACQNAPWRDTRSRGTAGGAGATRPSRPPVGAQSAPRVPAPRAGAAGARMPSWRARRPPSQAA